MSQCSKTGDMLAPTDDVDIAAEFGVLPQTPTRDRIDGKTTWTSPRRKRGHWGWGHSKNNRSSGLDHNEGKDESCPTAPPGSRMSIRNLFSSVRHGVFHGQVPATEDKKQDCAAKPQVELGLSHESPPAVVDDTGKKSRSQKLRHSKSLSFLGSISNTISSRRNSKQQAGMLRVYPGMDKLGRDHDTYDGEGSSPKRFQSDFKEEATTETEQLPDCNQTQSKYNWDNSESFDPTTATITDSSEHDIPRAKTPDSYLELLVESLCPPSDTSSLNSTSPYTQDKLDSIPPVSMEQAQRNGRVEEENAVANLLRSLEGMGLQFPQLQYRPEGYGVDRQHGQHHRDQRPIVSVREVLPLSDMELRAQYLLDHPEGLQDHIEEPEVDQPPYEDFSTLISDYLQRELRDDGQPPYGDFSTLISDYLQRELQDNPESSEDGPESPQDHPNGFEFDRHRHRDQQPSGSAYELRPLSEMELHALVRKESLESPQDHSDGHEVDRHHHRDQQPGMSARERRPLSEMGLRAWYLKEFPGSPQGHPEGPQDHPDGYEVNRHHHKDQEPILSARELRPLQDMELHVRHLQYYPEGPLFHSEWYEVDRRDQGAVVPVLEVCPPSVRAGTDDVLDIHNNLPEHQEGHTEFQDQCKNMFTKASIQKRVKRTLAVMTKNFYTSSDSEDGSLTGSEPFPETSHDSFVSLSTNEVNKPTPDRFHRQGVIKEGDRQVAPLADSGYDSGISWGVMGDEADGRNTEAGIPNSTSKETRIFEGKGKKERLIFDNNDLNKLLARGSLSNRGSGLCSSPLVVSGPVQVNFPKTAAGEGHTELYSSRSEAIRAIHRQNNGQFDSMCTFDPAIRVIFVHVLGSFIPNYDEIEKLGLELLSLPTCYDMPFYSRPDFSPYFNDENVRGSESRAYSASQPTNRLPKPHSIHNAGETVEGFWSPLTRHNGNILPSEDIQRQSPNSPTSVTTGDHVEWQEDGSVFEDDFFLEYDPIRSRSNIGSHDSGSISDVGQADSAQKSELMQTDAMFLTSHSAEFEEYTYTRVSKSSPVSWRDYRPKFSHPYVPTIKHFTRDGHLKTWPDLWREYITMTSSSSHHANASRDDTGGVFRHQGNLSQVSVEAESTSQTGTANGDYGSPPNIILDEDFKVELKEAENRSLQRAIDDIVTQRGGTLDRGIALISSPRQNIPKLRKKEDEGINVREIAHRQENRVPHIKDLIEKFETSATNSETEKQHMRIFSYPLEYSPPPPLQSSPSSDLEHQYATKRQRRCGQNQRSISETSFQSNASGFRFTTYLNELAEIASNGSTSASSAAKDDFLEGSHRALENVEPCRLPVDEDGLPRVITADDLNVRIVGKAAQESKFAKQDVKGSALVELFQSHGLMPKAQPTLRSPTTFCTSPFNNRTNQMSSAASPPTAPNSKRSSEGEVAKATALKEAFSRLSARSSSDADSAISGFGESLNKALPGQENLLWED